MSELRDSFMVTVTVSTMRPRDITLQYRRDTSETVDTGPGPSAWTGSGVSVPVPVPHQDPVVRPDGRVPYF